MCGLLPQTNKAPAVRQTLYAEPMKGFVLAADLSSSLNQRKAVKPSPGRWHMRR